MTKTDPLNREEGKRLATTLLGLDMQNMRRHPCIEVDWEGLSFGPTQPSNEEWWATDPLNLMRFFPGWLSRGNSYYED